MLALAQHNVSAMRFIRKLRGGSQPILAEANDGFLYVVKFSNNLQGPNLAFNESVGTELYRSVGLPVAPWQPITVTDSFIDANHACWIETASGLRRPEAGTCFGSRFMASEGTRLFEILPGNYIGRVRNRADFWLAWIVDVCADHVDNRQAIFRELPGGELNATFFDHGHMFGGADGQSKPRARASAYLDLRMYPEIRREEFLPSLNTALDGLNVRKFQTGIERLPDEWKKESAVHGLACCLERLSDRQFVTRLADTFADFPRLTDQRDKTDFQFRQFHSTPVLCPGVSLPAHAV